MPSGDNEDDSDGDEEGRRGNVLGDNLGSRESSSGHDALLVTRLHWGKHRQHRRHHHPQVPPISAVGGFLPEGANKRTLYITPDMN